VHRIKVLYLLQNNLLSFLELKNKTSPLMVKKIGLKAAEKLIQEKNANERSEKGKGKFI
jgi:hypothetical protein